jgi:tripartite-type tricarboxylate transporter receptor subunit TctC
MLRVLLAAILCVLSLGAQAQAWPSREVKILVIASPGGFPDITARILATHLSQSLGQPVMVENRAGAGGNIATLAVAKAAPDGHTVLLTGNNHAVNPTLLPNPGFDYQRDLAPVSMLAQANMIVLGSPAHGLRTMQDLMALAKKQPKGMSIATAAIGTPNHLGAEQLAALTGIEFIFVAYKGIAPAIPDLISGQVHVAIGALPAVLPLVKAGKVNAIAVTRAERSPLAPEIPTAAEAGLPGFDLNAWVCLMATGGTPAAIVNALNAEVRKVMARPDVRETFLKQGNEPVTSTPEELGAHIQAEAVKWAGVLKNARFRQ